jgi:uncharacterized protein (DUF2235 family)
VPADELFDAGAHPGGVHGNRVDARGISSSVDTADVEVVATFFQAWRKRQAERQAAAWEEDKQAARRAVDEVPPWIRSDVRRVIETLIEGPDSELQRAIDELWNLLEVDPDLRKRFFRLRVVEDAEELLK